jgi:drug/metabolite transporter (DMT)-like permease
MAGEAAAILAAVCWSISALCWTSAGKRVGSLVVNTIRLIIALPIFVLFGQFVLGEALPVSAPLECWLWLSLSGAVGFFLCDLFLFRSLVIMGPRITMLIFSLAPVVAALCARWWLNEVLMPRDIAGIVVALAGVLWVVSETPERGANADPSHHFSWKGGIFAFLAMLNQGIAGVISKVGMRGMDSAAAATQIRILGALPFFLVLLLVMRRQKDFIRAFSDRRSMGIITVGSVAGPTLGVALLMYSLKTIPTGIAMTLVSLMPVIIIPFTIVVYKERVTLRAVIGALIAVAGSALLSL